MITKQLRNFTVLSLLLLNVACSSLSVQEGKNLDTVETDLLQNQDEQTAVSKWSGEELKLFNIALTSIGNNDEKSERLFKKLIQQQPSMEAAYYNLMKLYFSQNATSKMDGLLTLAAQNNLLSARVQNLAGVHQRQLGHFKQAERYYTQAIKVDNHYLSALVNMAILQDIYLHNLPTAEGYYLQYQQQLILQGKTDPHIKNWLADIKRRISKLKAEGER